MIKKPAFGWEASDDDDDENAGGADNVARVKSPVKASPIGKGKSGGGKGSVKSSPAATPKSASKVAAAAEAGSAAPTPVKAAAAAGAKKEKASSVKDKMWELREHTHDLRKLVKELTGRTRSLRFFQSVRDLQQLDAGADVPCLACQAKVRL